MVSRVHRGQFHFEYTGFSGGGGCRSGRLGCYEASFRVSMKRFRGFTQRCDTLDHVVRQQSVELFHLLHQRLSPAVEFAAPYFDPAQFGFRFIEGTARPVVGVLFGGRFFSEIGNSRTEQRLLRFFKLLGAAAHLRFPKNPLIVFEPLLQTRHFSRDFLQGWTGFADVDNQIGPEIFQRPD